MPNPDARELVSLLVRKAEGDEAILDKALDDSDVPDDVLGFHVQQAVEKRLKAVLAFHEIDFDRTHSISYLTSLLEHHGIELPGDREQMENLTPWAVLARYQSSCQRGCSIECDRFVVTELCCPRREPLGVRELSRRLNARLANLPYEESEIVREREFGVGEHERDLQGFLDRLLRVKADDVVVDVRVIGECQAGLEIALRPAQQHLGVLDLLRIRRGHVPHGARGGPSCPAPSPAAQRARRP